MMKQSIAGVLLLGGVLSASACGATFVSTFEATGVEPARPQPGDKVVAVVVEKDEGRRRRHENALARELTGRGLEGIPSYQLVPVESLQDEAVAKAAFEKAGAVGAVVMRVIGVDTDTYVRPPSYYSGPMYGGYWGGYYPYGWSTVYSPGYAITETKVVVETMVYDLKQNVLLWAGTSRTANPNSADELIAKLVKSGAEELRRAGLVVRPR
jgi:hypothetical protein